MASGHFPDSTVLQVPTNGYSVSNLTQFQVCNLNKF